MRERLCRYCLLIALLFVSASGRARAGLLVFSHTGATDPILEGWTRTSGANVTFGPVINDLGLGIDAWYVYDNGATLGDLGAYLQTPSPAIVSLGNTYGWKLSAFIRVLPGSGAPAGSPMVLYRDGTRSWQMHFGTTSSGDPIVRLITGTSPPSGPAFTLAGGANQYHLYELIYDPVADAADLYVDGTLLYTGYVGFSWSERYVYWGAGSSYDVGKGHFSRVEFYVNPEPSTLALWCGLAAGAAVYLRRRRLHTPTTS